ncbi:MAG: hypothetical protein IT431_08880 [Phycisphaerales bacterium]|nr:hypothetical protein [Phycisphaerales bacterium]
MTGPVFVCPHCRYDLTSSVESRCPECGRAFEVVPSVPDAPRRGRLGPIAGAPLTLAGLAAWLALPGTGAWLDLGSLLLITCALPGVMLCTHGAPGLANAVRCLGPAHPDRYHRRHAVRWWREAAILAMLLSVIAATARAIALLQQLADPAELGRSIAASLFAQLYAAAAATALLLCSSRVARRGDHDAQLTTRPALTAAATLACSAATLLLISQATR